MEQTFNAYFCYEEQGNPIICEKEPKNFKELPYSYATFCPNDKIAEMIYKANLRIMKMRREY